MKERVLLGMSSGIDSSVAAILLRDKGFDVVGITFLFSDLDVQNQNMVDSARKLADSLNIEHHIINLKDEFQKKVISYFKQEYINGQTPFPCAVCNPEVKFKNLILYADKFDCKYISTGHYAQVSEKDDFKYISKGVESEKDQSFFLWGLDKSVVNRLIFPLGKYTKSQVKEIARKQGFSYLTQKKESLGICFIEDNNYRNYLKNSNIITGPGNFISPEGVILGRHKDYINFTIGQRRGLGLNLNKPLFVAEIRPKSNEVVLADFKELEKTKIYIQNFHFIHKSQVKTDKNYIVKIRYRLQENICQLQFINENIVEVLLEEPVSMVANGQTAVIYDEDCVIGGGFIIDSK